VQSSINLASARAISDLQYRVGVLEDELL